MEVRATRDQVEEFLNSILWKDIKRELGYWKKGFNQELMGIVSDSITENPSTATVLMHMGEIHGRVKAVDYLLELPKIFLQILEDEADDKEDR
jgi:hypothetical protein